MAVDITQIEQRLSSLETALTEVQQRLGLAPSTPNRPKTTSRNGDSGKGITRDVLKFALDHGMRECVEAAIQAARDSFGSERQVEASIKTDEYGDPYLDVHVSLQDETPETEAQNYSACAEKWATVVPPHVGGKIQLSTSWKS